MSTASGSVGEKQGGAREKEDHDDGTRDIATQQHGEKNKKVYTDATKQLQGARAGKASKNRRSGAPKGGPQRKMNTIIGRKGGKIEKYDTPFT